MGNIRLIKLCYNFLENYPCKKCGAIPLIVWSPAIKELLTTLKKKKSPASMVCAYVLKYLQPSSLETINHTNKKRGVGRKKKTKQKKQTTFIKKKSHPLREPVWSNFVHCCRRGSAGIQGEGRAHRGKSNHESLSPSVGELCEPVVLTEDQDSGLLSHWRLCHLGRKEMISGTAGQARCRFAEITGKVRNCCQFPLKSKAETWILPFTDLWSWH